MSMLIRSGLAGATLFAAATLATANPFGLHPVGVSYYSYPLYSQPYTLQSYPCYPAWPVNQPGALSVAPRPMAIPSPAPPSSTPPPLPPAGGTAGKSKPPESAPPPTVSETRTNPKEKVAAKPSPPPTAKDRCRAGFWNVSGKELVLNVNGEKRLLPPNRSITLDVGREFTWQVGNQPARTERVPEDRLVQEIILRE